MKKLCEIKLGDSLEVLKSYPDKHFDLCLTDPPYAITKASWDVLPSDELIKEIIRVSKKQIIFGGHFFNLPKKDGWIVWNKMPFLKTTNHCELIWTSFLKKNKVVDFLYAGNCVGSRKPNYDRPKVFFSSEKPVEFLEIVLKEFGKDCITVLDPFMGTGSTGVACANLGINFVGVEKEPQHFEICKGKLENR